MNGKMSRVLVCITPLFIPLHVDRTHFRMCSIELLFLQKILFFDKFFMERLVQSRRSTPTKNETFAQTRSTSVGMASILKTETVLRMVSGDLFVESSYCKLLCLFQIKSYLGETAIINYLLQIYNCVLSTHKKTNNFPFFWNYEKNLN